MKRHFIIFLLLLGEVWITFSNQNFYAQAQEKVEGKLQVKVGQQEDVFKPYSYGLTDFPDGLFGVLKKDGTYYWFIGSFPPGYDPEKDIPVTYLFRFAGTDLNKMKPDPIDKKGNAVKVLSPGSHGSYDDHIAGNGSVYFDEKTKKLYFWYQAMQTIPEKSVSKKIKHNSQAPYPYAYGTIGLAVSDDLGKKWKKVGVALKLNITLEEFIDNDSLGSTDPHPPCVIRDADFLYMYYNDYNLKNYSAIGELTVARLSITDLDENPQPWEKFYNGNFTKPADGGRYSKIIDKVPFPSVSYNSYLQQWIMAQVSWEDSNIYFRTSNDLIQWSALRLLIETDKEGNWLMAPTLIGIGDEPNITSQEFWVYYAYAPDERKYPPGAWMVRRKVRLD